MTQDGIRFKDYNSQRLLMCGGFFAEIKPPQIWNPKTSASCKPLRIITFILCVIYTLLNLIQFQEFRHILETEGMKSKSCDCHILDSAKSCIKIENTGLIFSVSSTTLVILVFETKMIKRMTLNIHEVPIEVNKHDFNW
jgi:hypothetical protein